METAPRAEHGGPEAFDRTWGLAPAAGEAEPVFVLAAGWRSGSTLLQRLLTSSGELWLWGEPYGRCDLLPALAAASRALGADWPTREHFGTPEALADPAEHWIANLFPPAASYRRAMEAALDELLRRPAEALGHARFGLKEVRLDTGVARFLAWIWPRARFFFLVRNPWDAWASARGIPWVLRWPDRVVADARAFARLWRALVSGFVAWEAPSGFVLRYEDLVAPEADLDELAAHARLARIDPGARTHVLRGMERPPAPLPDAEVRALEEVAGPLARALGYAGPGRTEAVPGAGRPSPLAKPSRTR